MREGGREGLGGFICHHWMSRGARITNETEDSNEPPELHFAASKNMEENRRRRGEGTEGGWKEDAEWGACVQ